MTVSLYPAVATVEVSERLIVTERVKVELEDPSDAQAKVYRRSLSPNELAYFLPSRENGVNDMFVRTSAPPFLTLCVTLDQVHPSPRDSHRFEPTVTKANPLSLGYTEIAASTISIKGGERG